MQPSERSKRSSEAQAFAGLIVRERNPENLEFPFSAPLESLRHLERTILCAQPLRRAKVGDAGAVGNAEWTGVPLAAVLKRAEE